MQCRFTIKITPNWLAFSACLLLPVDAAADVYIDMDQDDAYIISSQPAPSNTYIRLSTSQSESGARNSQQDSAIPYHQEVLYAAKVTKLNPALIHAVIAAESNHNRRAVSPKGAVGLMQLMPNTAKRFHVANAYDAHENILAGSKYLHELNQSFDGNLSLALAAYNAGPVAIKKHGDQIPPFKETQRYVPKVLKLYRDFAKKLNIPT